MRAIFVLLFVLFAPLFGDLKIATYNVENLFDGVENGSEYKDFKALKWGEERYQKKLNNIAKVLKRLNADIIALQEIENQSVLKALAKASGYEYFKFSGTQNAPVGLGLLSKIAFTKSDEIVIKNHKTRNILRLDFKLKDSEFSLFVLHFPAYNNGKGVAGQKAAARALKRAVAGVKNAIILGDFNANYSPNPKKFIHGELESLFKNGYVNLWDFIPPNQRFSHLGRTPRAIDHILLSKEFFSKNGSIKFKQGSFGAVFADFLLDRSDCFFGVGLRLLKGAKNLACKPSEIKPAKDGKENIYSDHLPLEFGIEFKGIK